MISLKFGIWLLLLYVQIKDTYCKGKISLKLLEYTNPTGTDAKGDCCDSPVNTPGCTIGTCDHWFRICLLDNISNSNTSNCLQSTEVTTSDKNVVKFDQNQQNVQFVFDTWKGEAPIKIEVFDSNTDDKQNVLIDQFLNIYNSTKAGFNQTSITAVNLNLIGTRSKNPTSLRFSLSVYCDPQYYGGDCSIKCVPTNKCDGHYTCDHQGNKVCLTGWRGTDCTEQVPGSDVDCSVYTNKTEFSTSEWEGMYSCDNKQHSYQIFLNATKPKDTLNIDATVSFRNNTVKVSGTYSSWSKALALQVDTSLLYEGHNLTKISLETREISTSGMIGQLSLYKADGGKLTCFVDPLNLKKAYFDGCDFKGTCVRYGKSKQNYYCCCNDGTIGTSCTKTTTPVATTTHTILTTKSTQRPTTTSIESTTTEDTTPIQTTIASTSTPKPTTQIPTTEPTTSPTTTQTTTLPTTKPTTIQTTTPKLNTTPTTTVTTTETTTQTETTSEPSTTSEPRTTHEPTTPSEPTTTSEPSTTPEQTTEPPTMMPTTTPTTTTASTTVTTRPTTVRTTLRPTTPKTTTPTTTTPKPTTVLTTTQKPTTLMTTTPTTLKPTTPVTVSLSDPFTLNLLMVSVELDGLTVVNTLLNSWIIENKGLLNLTKNNTEIDIGDYDETIAEGLPVTVIRYKVKVKSSVINTVSARRPNDNTLIQQLKIQYSTNQILLYTGSGPFFQLKDSLKFYVKGPGPVESQIKHMEEAIVSAHNNTCESNGKCEVTKETRAVIRMREEYVGDDGLEITEITYYIEIFGAVVLPTNYSDVSSDNYTEAFKAAGIHTVVYRGLKTLRYRFHYTLYIDGKVRPEDEKDFKAAIENTWFTTFPGYYTGCKDCFVQIVRQEKYLTDKGNEVTALIYYFYFHSILQVPLDFIPPNNTLMVDNTHVRGVDNSTYILYTSDVYSRYRNSFSLLLEGEEDIPTTSITDNLQAAFLNYSDSSKTIKVVLKTTENLIDDQGDLITDLVFFLMRDGEIIDARITDTPSLTWLRDWFVMQKVLKESGKHYMVYNKKGRDIFRMDQSWRINVEGFVMMSDMKTIELLLIDSVNVTIETANVEVQILKARIFMEKNSRKLMTAFYYVWRVNDAVQEESLTSTLIRENSIVYIRKHLSMLNYTLYDSNTSESTLFMDYHFELYFKMELSSIELLANFSSQLITALQAKWKGYTGQGLEVHVAFQEKVYIDSNQTEAWRVVFFLTDTDVTNGNRTVVIKSEFSKPITELLLYQTLPWTGLNELKYKLYTEARSQRILYKNQHFNMLLSREVSVFDWKHIETDLRVIWCKHLGCKDNTSISITITEQEKYVDISGNFYWNLVYFVMEHGSVIDSRRYHKISVTKDMFKWTNQYGGLYEVVVHRPVTMWKFSYGFHLYTDYPVTSNINYLKEALRRVWYLKGIVSENCKCLQIDTVHQRLVTDITGKTMWELTYFIRINGRLVHSTTWPRIDPALIDITSQKTFKFLTNIDTKLFVNLMSFYSNYKLSKKDITKVERELTTKFVDKNVEYKTCRCVSVKITSQEQVVNSKGEIVWKINYQVLKNKKTIKPSSIKPINWSSFNLNMTNIHGHKYHFSWGWTDWQKYFHYSYLGGLYVGSWIQPTDYTKFYSALIEYYKQHYKGQKIHIEGLNKTKEYYTSTGEKTWRLPFILTVDGKTVNPPALNTTEFEAMLTFNSTNGKSYKLKTGRHTIDATHIFSFNLNHKVSTTDHDKMKGAVITAWCTEHPGVDPSTVTVDITGQEELVDKTTGKSSWKLLYTLSVNGTKTDKWTSLSLTNSHLSSHLNFTSVTGVPYSTVDLKSYISTSSLHHLYFKSFVATTDFKMVAKKLKTSWTAKLKGMGLDNIDIKFIRQRPMVTETGEKIWSWEYVINMNNSVPINIPLPELSHTSLVAAFKNVTSTLGASLILVKPSTSNIEYNSHFSVYLSSKVTHNSYEEFKKRIIQAWKTKGMNVTIDHMTQEELVDKVDGHSVWRLVYFVKKEGKVVDSRTAVRLNTTIFHGITGPRGIYRVLNKVDQVDKSFLPYKWTSSVFVNHRFGSEATKKMSLLLKQMVEEKLHLIEENTVCNEVPADIQFLLDASGSVGSPNFKKQKDFVASFAESFTIGPDNTQIGVTTFSNVIKNKFNMNKYLVKGDLLAAIKNISYSGGKTFTDVALQYVGNHSFTKSAGDRDNAANVVIVMTDGKSRDFNKTKLEASKLYHAGIQVFAIGIGKGIQDNELKVIASDNDNVFTVDGFDALDTIQAKLKATTCKVFVVNKTVTEQTVTNVSVEVKRQEEYITSTGERVWKLVYFVKVNGQFVPATSVPGLDINQLISRLNITGPRGQKYQIVKTDRSMIYNYRNRFSVFFTGKVSETSLTAIQTALLETWNSTSKEYSLCGCLSIANISKENIEEFVDKNGKSYWRVMYFLKKNHTVVESMTHTGIDLDILKQKVKGIVNLRKEQYVVANVTESELIRAKLAFSFYLSKEMGYKQKTKFEQNIKSSWIKKMKGSLTYNNTEVTVNRYTKYIDIATKKTVWKVDYYLKKDGSLVDPSVTSMLTDLHLNLTDASGHSYTILQPTNVVDSKMGYKIFINREVRTKDRDKMKSVLVKWWKSTNNIDNKTVVHVDIPEQTQVLSGNKKYNMLSIFVKKEKTYVDSRETKDLNTTKIQSMINFNGVNNDKYTVNTVTSYKRLDTAFSMYLSRAIKRTEVTSVINEIKKTWKEKVFIDSKSNVSVTIGSQDWYLYKSMSKKKVSKLSYYLTVDGKAIHPDQVPEQDIKVPGRISPGPGLYSYKSLFHVDFTLPVLKTDIVNMEIGLKAAWAAFRTDLKQTKTVIVHQEEMVSSSRLSSWRLWYRITANNTAVSPVQEDSVKSSTLQTHLNVTRRGSNMLYGKLVKSTTEAVFEYDNLLSIHFAQRVADSDFNKVQDKLLVLWKKKIGIKVKHVTVLKQEETIQKSYSETVWKLSYHITTTDGTTVNSQLDATPSYKEYTAMGVVSNPLLEPYFMTDVDAFQTYRLTQAFKVMLNRRIYNVDKKKFDSVVKQTLAKKVKASNVSDVKLIVFNEQEVVTTVSNSSKTVWRYNYIVDVSGNILNAAEEGGITQEDLQQEINFTSPRQQKYTVIKSDISTVAYSDLFQVHFFGIIPNDKKLSLMNHVKLYWENVTAYSSVELSSVSREDTFEDITGKSLTTFTFILTANGKMMYPSLTEGVNYTKMVVPEVQVFPGKTLNVTRYSWCFKLVLQSQHKPINKTIIKTLLENVWNASKQGYSLRVISTEPSVGDLGIHLTSVLYDQKIGEEAVVTPDMEMEPDTKVMKKEAEKLKIQGKPYSAAEYRINTLFTASVRYENTMTVTDNQNVENVLNLAVANATKYQLKSIKTHVLLKKDYVSSSNTSVKIAKLYFKLEINNTTRKLWETSLATLKYKLDNQLDPKVQTDTTSIPQRKVYVLYLKGKVQKTDKLLLSALKINWMAVAPNKTVIVKIIDTSIYVDVSWKLVTKVRYIVSINDTDPESKGINPPKYTALNANLSQCGCSATSPKKHYVYSKTINSTRVRTAISTVWNGANKGLSSTALSVRVKQQSRRQKRDTHTSHKLVDGNGREVTPMEYTVAVEDEEPQPLFVNIPSNNDIKAPLKQAGSEPCLCKPKLAGSLQLDGQTQDADKPKIVDAIKDAFVKENPDVTKPDLDVTVTGINNKAKDKDGNPVSEVNYRVGRKSEDVEDLKSPSTAHLQQSLATAGKTLHSRAPKDEDNDKKWTLPLAIALGILAAVIVIAIICCCIHKRRHRKREDLVKREHNVKKNNLYDQEHFSDPAAYDNNTYEGHDFQKVSL